MWIPRSGWYAFGREGESSWSVYVRVNSKGVVRFKHAPKLIRKLALQALVSCRYQWRAIEIPEEFPVESSA